MAHADFRDVYAEGAYFTNAYLMGSLWAGKSTNLKGTHFEETRLTGADFQNVYAEGATLSRSDVSGSNWRSANLKNSDLSCSCWNGADMEKLYLGGAKLYGADLSNAIHLTREQLQEADGDNLTKLNYEGLRPPNWSRTPKAACPTGSLPFESQLPSD